MSNLPRTRFRGFYIAVYHRVAGTKSPSRHHPMHLSIRRRAEIPEHG